MLGCDPEVFVTDAVGRLLPAWKFLPHKKEPIVCTHPVAGSLVEQARGNAFWDGFQAEFTTQPQGCIAYVPDNIRPGLLTCIREARKIEPRAKLSLQNVFQIPIATLKNETEEHVLLGCDPSFNAYYMSGQFPGDPRKLRYRFAGGHIHVEGVATALEIQNDIEKRQQVAAPVVKSLDKILGVWAVGAAASFDNPIRRRYYGLAGEYRLPKHGVEYRTLSNFWLCHSTIVNLVFELTRSITYAVTSPYRPDRAKAIESWVAHPQEVVEAINNCDVKLAREILKRNRDFFRELVPIGGNTEAKDIALKVGMHGIESIIRDPEDFDTNWQFENHGWLYHSEGRNMNWSRASNALAIDKELRL